MKALTFATAILVAGCAPFVRFSQMGPDTYAVETGQSFYGRERAAAFCSQRGRYVLITNTEQRFDGATTIFRCLAAGDPEYRRPTYESPPAAIIRDERRK